MIKTKVIGEGDDGSVEYRINSFIANPSNKVKEVRDIKFSSAYADRLGILYSSMIIYEEESV